MLNLCKSHRLIHNGLLEFSKHLSNVSIDADSTLQTELHPRLSVDIVVNAIMTGLVLTFDDGLGTWPFRHGQR